MSQKIRSRFSITVAVAAVALAGCASGPIAGTRSAVNNDDYYQVEHDGRLYVFDGRAVFRDFVSHWETPYRKVRIGAGPEGMTLVFGLRGEDKKKSDGIAAIEMHDGRMQGADSGFYAEAWSEGRIYVFDRWEDLASFRTTGEANLRYTDIGAGPDGRTVVYVLNDGNKTVKPVALMETFDQVHGI